jgi:hypothetical protein
MKNIGVYGLLQGWLYFAYIDDGFTSKETNCGTLGPVTGIFLLKSGANQNLITIITSWNTKD